MSRLRRRRNPGWPLVSGCTPTVLRRTRENQPLDLAIDRGAALVERTFDRLDRLGQPQQHVAAPRGSRSVHTRRSPSPLHFESPRRHDHRHAGRRKNGAHTPSPCPGAWSGSMPTISPLRTPSRAAARRTTSPARRGSRRRARPAPSAAAAPSCAEDIEHRDRSMRRAVPCRAHTFRSTPDAASAAARSGPRRARA